MPYSTTNPEFDAVLKRLGDLHDRKNAGYANSGDPLANFRIANKFGIKTSDSIAVRLSDKINRWLNLMENNDLDKVGEALEDTMDDMVVYGMLWLVARAEEAAAPSVEKSYVAPRRDICQHDGVEDASDCAEADTFNYAEEMGIVVAWTPEQYAANHGDWTGLGERTDPRRP